MITILDYHAGRIAVYRDDTLVYHGSDCNTLAVFRSLGLEVTSIVVDDLHELPSLTGVVAPSPILGGTTRVFEPQTLCPFARPSDVSPNGTAAVRGRRKEDGAIGERK